MGEAVVSVRGSGRGRVWGRDPAPLDAPDRGGGRGGDGGRGLRLPSPSRELGYGLWAWDATQVPSAGSIGPVDFLFGFPLSF